MSPVRILSPFLLSLALGIAAGVPGAAQGAPAGGPAAAQPEARQGRWLERMASRLNLTDAQKTSVQGIFAKHRDALAAQGRALREARRAFQQALAKPDTGAETLRSLHDALAQAELNRILEARALHQEVRAVLTPEQREQAARMEGRMQGMRMARFGCAPGLRGGMGRMGMMPAPDAAPKAE